MILRAALLFLILLYWSAYGQENKEDLNDSAHFHSSASLALANVDLPAHVIAPMGQVTLFADYDNAKEKGMPLYLVNRTSERLILDSQDGDIYLKLEFQREDGTWQRAQGHRSSWCGNSCRSEYVNPGQHIKMEGYHPARGTAAKIRYACYGSAELLSNVGQGFYRPEDAELSQKDGMAYRMTPSALIQCLSLGEVESQFISWTDRIAALRLAQVLGGRASIKAEAEKWRNELTAKDSLTPDESAALAALPALLASAWADAADTEKLFRHCLELLVAPPKGTGVFGSPESHPGLLWEVLWDLKVGPMVAYPPQQRIPVEAWQPVLKLAAQRLPTLDERSREMAVMILKYERLADEFLSDAEWELLLLSGHEQVVELAATALARRTRWDRLVELGLKLPAADQVTVLYFLAKGQSWMRYPEQSSQEEKFWLLCIKNSPTRVARAWRRLTEETEMEPSFGGLLNQTLLDYWSAKVSAWVRAEEDFELKSEGDELEDTLEYVMQRPRFNDSTKFRSGEDVKTSLDEWTVLLRQLVTNRGYEMAYSDPFAGRREDRRDFVLRDLAIKTLKSLGEPVEPD